MNEEGKKIVESFQAMRTFYENIALLLKTSDDMMGHEDWECIHGNLAIFRTSNSIQRAKDWIPWEAFRFYRNSGVDFTNIILCISILLDVNKNEYEGFIEPIVTANIFIYKDPVSKEEIKKYYYYGWSRMFGWLGQLSNGKVIEKSSEKIREEWNEDSSWYTFDKYKGFAWPLTDIHDAETFKVKIIQPLINLI